ncbi:hypothetical protein B0H19DRAFT_1238740 [Mycena capillaripes]|nr:hypothetical protein B0H19DRAFT_1238740 [Mycena capillaripes]
MMDVAKQGEMQNWHVDWLFGRQTTRIHHPTIPDPGPIILQQEIIGQLIISAHGRTPSTKSPNCCCACHGPGSSPALPRTPQAAMQHRTRIILPIVAPVPSTGVELIVFQLLRTASSSTLPAKRSASSGSHGSKRVLRRSQPSMMVLRQVFTLDRLYKSWLCLLGKSSSVRENKPQRSQRSIVVSELEELSICARSWIPPGPQTGRFMNPRPPPEVFHLYRIPNRNYFLSSSQSLRHDLKEDADACRLRGFRASTRSVTQIQRPVRSPLVWFW